MSLERPQNRRGQQGNGREEESTPPSKGPLTTSPGGGDGRGAAGKNNLPHPSRALLLQPV